MNEQDLSTGSDQASNPTDSALSFADIYKHSIDDPNQFWAEQAKRIYWHKEPEQILDDSNWLSIIIRRLTYPLYVLGMALIGAM